ncbi:MAG: transcriptional regulator [Clostridia bacterium]|nr:transcriptional regulator [Clostridia bacterium]
MSKSPENSQYRMSENFSKRIKHLIYDNDCQSNAEFAKLLGVSEPIISKAVTFGIYPSLRTLIKIADKLDISIKYLMGIEDNNEFIMSTNPTTFHTRLAELTTEHKTKFARVASKTSFQRTYIYQWNKIGTLPSIDYLFEIADYFKVSPDYLLGRTDYRN